MEDRIFKHLLIGISSLFYLLFKPTQDSPSLFISDKLGICAAKLHKLFMCAALNNISMLQNDYFIAVTDGRKPVCNNDAGYTSVLDGFYNFIFGLCVKC